MYTLFTCVCEKVYLGLWLKDARSEAEAQIYKKLNEKIDEFLDLGTVTLNVYAHSICMCTVILRNLHTHMHTLC